jgi:hypothetical protein
MLIELRGLHQHIYFDIILPNQSDRTYDHSGASTQRYKRHEVVSDITIAACYHASGRGARRSKGVRAEDWRIDIAGDEAHFDHAVASGSSANHRD